MITSFHTGTLGELSAVDAARRVLDAGYDAVELNAETLPWAPPHVGPDTPNEVRSRLAALGPYAAIAAHGPGLSSPNDEIRRKAIDWTIGCAQLACDIGAPIIHVIPGDGPADETLGFSGGRGDLDSFRRSLIHIVEACEPLGIRVGLEPIVNQLIATTDGAEQLLAEIPGLGISFDPSHLFVATHDVAGAARRLGSRVTNAALKDGHGDPHDFAFPFLGEGQIDFVEMLVILREQGFDGAVSVEYEAHVFGDTRPPDVVLAESKTFLDRVLAEAGAASMSRGVNRESGTSG